MSADSKLNRRTFLEVTGGAAAAVAWTASSYAKILGANDRINIGFIGAGGMGNAHLDAINQLNRGSLRLWYMAHLKLGLRSVVPHHNEIIEALEGRQRANAEEVMRQHVLRSQSRVIEALASGREAAPGNGKVQWEGADE